MSNIDDLRLSIDDLILDDSILPALLPKGRPHDHESVVWDYKEELPTLPCKNNDAIEKFNYELSCLIKDAVAFHNAYGGNIVFGIKDRGNHRVVGTDGELDAGDFNKRIEGATGISIECFISYKLVNINETSHRIGILLVPRRVDGSEPVAFKKAGPKNAKGDQAFKAKDIYIRVRDECRPATATSADWKFLHGLRSPGVVKQSGPVRPVTGRLPARDPDLVTFIGREDFLGRLRAWLADRRDPIRLLSGIGGLGKTAIAYRFVEEVISTGAGEIERIVWLTAKEKTFSALRGKIVESSHTDFSDPESLYREILEVLGYHPRWDDEEPQEEQTVDALIEAFSTYCCLVVIDDVDSLDPESQRAVVHTINSVVQRTVVSSNLGAPSRVLLTSRLDQGLPPRAESAQSGSYPVAVK